MTSDVQPLCGITFHVHYLYLFFCFISIVWVATPLSDYLLFDVKKLRSLLFYKKNSSRTPNAETLPASLTS